MCLSVFSDFFQTCQTSSRLLRPLLALFRLVKSLQTRLPGSSVLFETRQMISETLQMSIGDSVTYQELSDEPDGSSDFLSLVR